MAKAELRRITGPWRLSDLKQVPSNGLTAFSCFHCGGGSTMGYKLAGFDVLGGVEIDPEMMSIYRANHRPRHSYLMGVQQFNQLPLDELPDELKNLDLLDGSPPCSVFSMAGKRDKKWGSEHHFREGQQKQRLDDLFMHFIEVGQRLQPKVIVAENVKGLILGNAKGYVKEIFAAFRKAGYDVQLFLFNAARMGIPQRRERTFFVARRCDMDLPKLTLAMKEPLIQVGEAIADVKLEGKIVWLTPETKALWSKVNPGDPLSKAHPKGYRFNAYVADPKKPVNTLAASPDSVPIHWEKPRRFIGREMCRVQSFPDDYDFCGVDAGYVMGMSVPPFMTQRVALEIGRQWFGVEYA
jgi:DNA (cytosine-5)-methyltransferase 1